MKSGVVAETIHGAVRPAAFVSEVERDIRAELDAIATQRERIEARAATCAGLRRCGDVDAARFESDERALVLINLREHDLNLQLRGLRFAGAWIRRREGKPLPDDRQLLEHLD